MKKSEKEKILERLDYFNTFWDSGSVDLYNMLSNRGRKYLRFIPEHYDSIRAGRMPFDDKCFWCGESDFKDTFFPTKDHVIPVKKGGKLVDGWVTSCEKCNGKRGHKDFILHLRENRRLTQ